jgi:hypothetical protein
MSEGKPAFEYENIANVIEESRNRAFQKVSEELVLLYFSVGKTVSIRVSEGAWGDKTVDELSAYILNRIPGLGGFTCRRLYRMRQFYETYSPDADSQKTTGKETHVISRIIFNRKNRINIDWNEQSIYQNKVQINVGKNRESFYR